MILFVLEMPNKYPGCSLANLYRCFEEYQQYDYDMRPSDRAKVRNRQIRKEVTFKHLPELMLQRCKTTDHISALRKPQE
jgi:hypothetical protein